MSEINVGDRVHVEFDGEVVDVDSDDTIRVKCSGMPIAEFAWVLPTRCTLLSPPIAVGDMVYPNNIHQLPDRSLIAADGGVPWIKDSGCWHFGDQDMSSREVGIRGDQRVLRIGGGDQ